MKLINKQIVEKIINLLLNILIVIFSIIFLISIYTGVQTKILGHNYNNFFGYTIFEVQTGSMTGTIDAGDWIIVKLTQQVQLNDIVTYELGGEYITHRIIKAYNNNYVTKGDANSGEDEPIKPNQIIGRVVNIWPNLGILRKTFFNPSVLIALIITLFLFNYVIKKNKVEKKKNKKTKFSKDENIYLYFDIFIKKVWVILKDLIKKINLLIWVLFKRTKNLFKYIKKDVKNDVIPENNKLKHNEVLSNLDDFSDDMDYYKDEDELDKTLFYRVVPVDAEEVDDKYKENITKEDVEDYYKDEDELDKTSLYRVISVDASEMNDTLLEIAENEIKETDPKYKEKETDDKLKEEQIEVNEDETLADVNLNLLKNAKNKKGSNIIDMIILYKKEELNEIINILVKDDPNYIKRVTIKNKFMDTYIDARYYNYFGVDDIKGKSIIAKIEKVLKKLAHSLITEYRGKNSKHKDIVNKYADLFILIAKLEKGKDSISDLKAQKEFYIKELNKYAENWRDKKINHVIKEIIKLQKTYLQTLEVFLKKLETNMFELIYKPLDTNKNMYGLTLEHNLSFSKVYSDYIIDKTYTEGIIAEDKLTILLTLLSAQLIRNIMSFDFDKKYFFYIPSSLYTKEKKLKQVLKMIDERYGKYHIVIILTGNDLLNNKQVIKKTRKQGYNFALAIDKKIPINKTDRGLFYVVDYIFINKNIANKGEIISLIPKDLSNKIITEDLFDKVGDLGGEQA
jgi:hypothetical protein